MTREWGEQGSRLRTSGLVHLLPLRLQAALCRAEQRCQPLQPKDPLSRLTAGQRGSRVQGSARRLAEIGRCAGSISTL